MYSIDSIYSIKSEDQFQEKALQAFLFHYQNNALYHQYVRSIGVDVRSVDSMYKIPFLPIEFFKTHKIMLGKNAADTVFFSSGTTGARSMHYVSDVSIYKNSFSRGFSYFYGNVRDYVILALLPSYLENGNSSLVYMVTELIAQTGSPYSGFFLHNHSDLFHMLNRLGSMGKTIMLFGVPYALLDFGETHRVTMPNMIIVETGGMKGQKREVTKEELYSSITQIFGTVHIHSEYGMTELLSQAYSTQGNVFEPVPWMKVLIRELTDPFAMCAQGKTGGINVIDLANVYSCPFIETKDVGKKCPDSSFQVLGRIDNSDIRGCNLMIFK